MIAARKVQDNKMFSSLRTLMRIIIPSRTTIYLVLFIAILNLCTSPIDSKLLSWPVRYYALSTFRHWYEGTPQEARANTETGTDGDARDRQAQPNPPANEEEHRTLSQALYSLLRRLVILYIRDYLFIASTAGILAVLLKAAADLGLFWLALPWARMHACDALLKLPALVNLSDPQALWKANICAWQYKGAGLETVNRLFGRTLAVYWRMLSL